ncbi:hypothetical protein FGM00_18025 [Aggregatimonas sangjinii]|uniref:Uncharacterized protein n=1 Tax=Aggregatimonas sangjinii TaxID=2583587 RepID=A0A5B7SXA9_9FLAO|nr:hypothetical protein [Aggregatimonas sangjinii]QCX01919.1 hypothetical protein FGM00_18025 [Aggregatimonas sangjinii]
MIGILLLMFGPALLFLVIAFIMLIKNDVKKAKIFFILTGVYLLISLGICGIMLANFTLDTK